MKTNIQTLQLLKSENKPITMLTAYDFSMAHIISEAGVDVILIGDSLGNVIQGYSTTVPVNIEDMTYHTKCVSAGNKNSFLVADLPFMSYTEKHQAVRNAAKLMQAGAMMVKMEGGKWLVPIVNHLTEKGIPVCGHLGLTPQTIHKLGGFKMQAKNEKEAETLLNDAITLEQAGIQLLVLECIPDLLAYEISRTLKIPVIGIGAGNQTDGQVLVVYDLLGISTFIPKFAKNFLQEASGVKEAIVNYVESVRNRSFPK